MKLADTLYVSHHDLRKIAHEYQNEIRLKMYLAKKDVWPVKTGSLVFVKEIQHFVA